jgi:hypothetical protein
MSGKIKLKVGVGYIYKVAFLIVGALFTWFLVGGIYALLNPGPAAFEGLSNLGTMMLFFLAALLLPLEIWLGMRVFKKRANEETTEETKTG